MDNDSLPKNSFIDPSRKESYPSTSLSDFSTVTSYEVFATLTFWNKIDFLQQTMDKKLLEEIKQKSPSKQMRALAIYRLHKLPN